MSRSRIAVSRRSRIAVCHARGSRCVTIEDRGSRCFAIEDRGVSRLRIEDRGVAIEDRGVANNYKPPKFCPVRRSIQTIGYSGAFWYSSSPVRLAQGSRVRAQRKIYSGTRIFGRGHGLPDPPVAWRSSRSRIRRRIYIRLSLPVSS